MTVQSPYRETCSRCSDLEAQVANKNEIIEKLGADLRDADRRAWLELIKGFGEWATTNAFPIAMVTLLALVAAFGMWLIYHDVTKPRPPPAPEVCLEYVEIIVASSTERRCPLGTLTVAPLGTDSSAIVHCTCPMPEPREEYRR